MLGVPLQNVRTFELVVNIDGVLDVPWEDWPANIQDGIMAALEQKARQVELPLTIVYAEYKTDPDIKAPLPGRHYLHVIASEVIVADERNMAPGQVVKKPIQWH